MPFILLKKFHSTFTLSLYLALACLFFVSNAANTKETLSGDQASQRFIALLRADDPVDIHSTTQALEDAWQDAYIPFAIETILFARSAYTGRRLRGILQRKTGQKFDRDMHDWYSWMWNRPENIAPGYADFKAYLYKHIDPKFETYFKQRQSLARIRLDEIRWGGVMQDGIPPLRQPKMISAKKADYLADDNIIFGIEINGDARAYPKRILAWHEMFVDKVGGVDIAGVYCTLCGTVIPYKTRYKDRQFNLGTSGFLYRSNKLMYDKETQSLWNTLQGEPVLGPLVDKGIALEHLSVVTTTWGEWLKRHPDTTVLSLQTGHQRDYGEGVAYQDYFATDELMFHTPFEDKRLKNKQEVLALRFSASPTQQLAIDTDFLNKHPLFKENIGLQKILVLTDSSGANRVYDPKDVDFVHYDREHTLRDNKGNTWQLNEENLVSDDGRALHRLPYHRAFWFGWVAAYPQTRLIK